MKDISDNVLFLILCICLIFLMLCMLLYDNSNSRNTNTKLKNELYEAKQKINKLEDEKLKLLITCTD